MLVATNKLIVVNPKPPGFRHIIFKFLMFEEKLYFFIYSMCEFEVCPTRILNIYGVADDR
jgi:hypothetical protein